MSIFSKKDQIDWVVKFATEPNAEVFGNRLGYPYQKACLTPQYRLPECPPL